MCCYNSFSEFFCWCCDSFQAFCYCSSSLWRYSHISTLHSDSLTCIFRLGWKNTHTLTLPGENIKGFLPPTQKKKSLDVKLKDEILLASSTFIYVFCFVLFFCLLQLQLPASNTFSLWNMSVRCYYLFYCLVVFFLSCCRFPLMSLCHTVLMPVCTSCGISP